MTIEKLPSGKYRIREMKNGRRVSVIVPYKPSKKDAFALLQDKMQGTTHVSSTLGDACQTYLEAKSNVLSPSTLRGYNSMLRNIPDRYLSMEMDDVDNLAMQQFINEYSAGHSPKSTANMYGFIRAVLAFFMPDVNIHTTLPQKRRTEHYTPSQADVKAILDASKNTSFYIPLYLASLSCRCSEICALTLDDLDGDVLTINKAKIRAEHGYVIKNTPKTDASNRKIVLPHDLAEYIRERGEIYPYFPRNIYNYLCRLQKRLGLPQFGIHRLRHFFASYSHDLGYSDAQIQSIGGWNTDMVMKTVYRHAMDMDTAKQTMAKDFSF